ncbi:RNA-guided endonuclease IscB [Vibrio rotiferianus]
MQRTFVLDSNKQPLMPCHPARARKLLKSGQAAVYRQYPFTIILTQREDGDKQPLETKLDPGSKTTGIALNLHGKNGIKTVWAANLSHRGHQISEALTRRRAIRSLRRNRKTRYRQARFDNRKKQNGWLAPSIMSRVHNCETWTKKLIRFSPVTQISIETVRFDTQKMSNPDIQGAEYQQGTLAGFELREYLLLRDKHTCQYCHGASNDSVLNVDHIQPRAKGGTNSVKNLVIACRTCNKDKNSLSLADWKTIESKKRTKLAKARATAIPKIMANRFNTMRDAAAVNVSRYRLGNSLKELGLPVTFASGGQTKFNRTCQGYEKDHWIDAACVGYSGSTIQIPSNLKPLLIQAKGHGSRQMCRVDKYGFPRTTAKENSSVHGFKTGDIVVARVPSGAKQGNHHGRVAVRANGYFNINTGRSIIQGVSHKHCYLIHASDGYSYH